MSLEYTGVRFIQIKLTIKIQLFKLHKLTHRYTVAVVYVLEMGRHGFFVFNDLRREVVVHFVDIG